MKIERAAIHLEAPSLPAPLQIEPPDLAQATHEDRIAACVSGQWATLVECEKIARALANSSPLANGNSYESECQFCEGRYGDSDIEHKPDCLWVRARKATGQ